MNRFAQLESAPIFVVGAARSGTTWVYEILAQHPAVAGIYESWLFTPGHGVKAIFSSRHRWPGNQTGLGRVLDHETLIQLLRQFVEKIMSHAIEPQHRFLVEKSPNHLWAIPQICELFPEARFIYVLRDGRDVNVSVRAAARSWVPEWKRDFGGSVASSAKAWQSAVMFARQQKNSIGDNFLEVRYEEIHVDPISAYKRLFDFCNIPYDESLLDDIFEATDFNKHYASSAGEAKFRRGGRTGDWRTRFSIFDALIFNFVAGKTLVDLSYEDDRFWLPNLFGVQPRLRKSS